MTAGWTDPRRDQVKPLDNLDDLIGQARQLDLATAEGCLRLGEIADELLGTGLPDIFDRLAIDLDVDPELVSDAWHVASAYPPATRRPGISWSIYDSLRRHPDRHELVDLAARHGWTRDDVEREVSARFAARYLTRAAG
jgi:hypothetical protein